MADPRLTPYLTSVEDELARLLQAPSAELAPLYGMMRYHLGWADRDLKPLRAASGKRLRPLVCLLCCEAACGEWQRAVPAAAAIELIHNFSLVHDDIEDNSPLRRGRETVWRLWGLAHGVNVGDTMFTLSRVALASLADRLPDASTSLRATHILDRSCLRLCQGQYMDLAGEGRLDTNEEWYLQMIAGKTAVLFAASAQLGAIIAAATAEAEHYRQFGFNLGMAFQMVDDILGIWGDPQVTGKPTASDIRDRKMTLPVIYALTSCSAGPALAELYRKAQLGEQDVSQAMDILDGCGARRYVELKASELEATARESLAAAKARPPTLDLLLELASSVTVRHS